MKPGYRVISQLSAEHKASLAELFRNEWWTRDRTAEDVTAACDGSDVVIGLERTVDESLVGFARVLTDWRFIALVLDVIVEPRLRAQGLGRMLMDCVVGHPRLSEVRSIELVCQPDLLAFYAKWGFTDRVGKSRLMRRTDDKALVGEETTPN